MAAEYRLTAEAEDDLQGIADYTFETFGTPAGVSSQGRRLSRSTGHEAGILLRPVSINRREPTPKQEEDILAVVDHERKAYAEERRR